MVSVLHWSCVCFLAVVFWHLRRRRSCPTRAAEAQVPRRVQRRNRRSRSSSTKKCKQTTTYVVCPDMEGRVAHLWTWLKANDITYTNGVLHIQPNIIIVFAGDLAPDKVSNTDELIEYTELLLSIIQHERTVIVAGNRDINKFRLSYEVDLMLANPDRSWYEIPTMKKTEIIERFAKKQIRTIREYLNNKQLELNAMTVLEFLLSETMGCESGTAKVHFDTQKKRSGFLQTDTDYDKIWRELHRHWFSTTGLYTKLLHKSKAMFYDESNGMLVVHGSPVPIRQQMKVYKDADGRWCHRFETLDDTLSISDVCDLQNQSHTKAVQDCISFLIRFEKSGVMPNDESLKSLCYLAFMSATSFVYDSLQLYGRIDYKKVNDDKVTDFFDWFKHHGGKLCIHAHQPVGKIPSHCVINDVIVFHIDTSALSPLEWSLKCEKERLWLRAKLNFGCELKYDAQLLQVANTRFTVDGYAVCDTKPYAVGNEYIGVVMFGNLTVGYLYKRGILGTTRRDDGTAFAQKYIFEFPFGCFRFEWDALV